MGLEPTHPKAYAPQTYVSTIPPPGHLLSDREALWYVYPSRMSSVSRTRSREYGSRIFAFAHFEPHIYHSTTWAKQTEDKN
jgi:hypothetical protein